MKIVIDSSDVSKTLKALTDTDKAAENLTKSTDKLAESVANIKADKVIKVDETIKSLADSVVITTGDINTLNTSIKGLDNASLTKLSKDFSEVGKEILSVQTTVTKFKEVFDGLAKSDITPVIGKVDLLKTSVNTTKTNVKELVEILTNLGKKSNVLQDLLTGFQSLSDIKYDRSIVTHLDETKKELIEINKHLTAQRNLEKELMSITGRKPTGGSSVGGIGGGGGYVPITPELHKAIISKAEAEAFTAIHAEEQAALTTAQLKLDNQDKNAEKVKESLHKDTLKQIELEVAKAKQKAEEENAKLLEQKRLAEEDKTKATTAVSKATVEKAPISVESEKNKELERQKAANQALQQNQTDFNNAQDHLRKKRDKELDKQQAENLYSRGLQNRELANLDAQLNKEITQFEDQRKKDSEKHNQALAHSEIAFQKQMVKETTKFNNDLANENKKFNAEQEHLAKQREKELKRQEDENLHNRGKLNRELIKADQQMNIELTQFQDKRAKEADNHNQTLAHKEIKFQADMVKSRELFNSKLEKEDEKHRQQLAQNEEKFRVYLKEATENNAAINALRYKEQLAKLKKANTEAANAVSKEDDRQELMNLQRKVYLDQSAKIKDQQRAIRKKEEDRESDRADKRARQDEKDRLAAIDREARERRQADRDAEKARKKEEKERKAAEEEAYARLTAYGKLKHDIAKIKEQVATRGITSLATTDNLVKGYAAFQTAVGVGDFVKGVLETTDSYTLLGMRMKMFSASEETAKASMEALYQSSLKLAMPMEALATLGLGLTDSFSRLGMTSDQTSAYTEKIATLLAVSGATAKETESATLQLSQAMGAGALRGEEYNAVNEAMPILLTMIAKEMNVTRGALKHLAADGLITADVIVKTLYNNQKLIENYYSNIGDLATRSMTNFVSVSTKALNQVDQAFHISPIIARVIDLFNSLIGTVGNLAEALKPVGDLLYLAINIPLTALQLLIAGIERLSDLIKYSVGAIGKWVSEATNGNIDLGKWVEWFDAKRKQSIETIKGVTTSELQLNQAYLDRLKIIDALSKTSSENNKNILNPASAESTLDTKLSKNQYERSIKLNYAPSMQDIALTVGQNLGLDTYELASSYKIVKMLSDLKKELVANEQEQLAIQKDETKSVNEQIAAGNKVSDIKKQIVDLDDKIKARNVTILTLIHNQQAATKEFNSELEKQVQLQTVASVDEASQIAKVKQELVQSFREVDKLGLTSLLKAMALDDKVAERAALIFETGKVSDEAYKKAQDQLKTMDDSYKQSQESDKILQHYKDMSKEAKKTTDSKKDELALQLRILAAMESQGLTQKEAENKVDTTSNQQTKITLETVTNKIKYYNDLAIANNSIKALKAEQTDTGKETRLKLLDINANYGGSVTENQLTKLLQSNKTLEKLKAGIEEQKSLTDSIHSTSLLISSNIAITDKKIAAIRAAEQRQSKDIAFRVYTDMLAPNRELPTEFLDKSITEYEKAKLLLHTASNEQISYLKQFSSIIDSEENISDSIKQQLYKYAANNKSEQVDIIGEIDSAKLIELKKAIDSKREEIKQLNSLTQLENTRNTLEQVLADKYKLRRTSEFIQIDNTGVVIHKTGRYNDQLPNFTTWSPLQADKQAELDGLARQKSAGQLTDKAYAAMEKMVNDTYRYKLEILRLNTVADIEKANIDFSKELLSLSSSTSLNSKMKEIEVWYNEEKAKIEKQMFEAELSGKDGTVVKDTLDKLKALKKAKEQALTPVADLTSQYLTDGLENGKFGIFFDELSKGMTYSVFDGMKEGMQNAIDSANNYLKTHFQLDDNFDITKNIASAMTGYKFGNIIGNMTGYKSSGILSGQGLGAIGGLLGGTQGAIAGSLIGSLFGTKSKTKEFLQVVDGAVTKVVKTRTSSAFGLDNTSHTTYTSANYYSKTFEDLIINFKQLGYAAASLSDSWGKTASEIKSGMAEDFISAQNRLLKLRNSFYATTYAKLQQDTGLTKPFDKGVTGFDGIDSYFYLNVTSKLKVALTKAEYDILNSGETIDSITEEWRIAASENNKSLEEFVSVTYGAKKQLDLAIKQFNAKSTNDKARAEIASLKEDLTAYGIDTTDLAEVMTRIANTIDPKTIERLTQYGSALLDLQTKQQSLDNSILEERLGIEIDIESMTDSVTKARKKELDALDETNKALKEQYYAQLDYKAGIDIVQSAIDEQINTFNTKASDYETMMNNAGSRANDLITKGLEDIVTAVNDAADTALEASQNSRQASIDAINEQISNYNNVIGSLEQYLKQQDTANATLVTIRNALNDLQKGSAISDSISMLSENKADFYSTYEEYITSQREIYNTASAQLKAQQSGLSEAERSLKVNQEQLDALKTSATRDVEYYTAHLEELGNQRVAFQDLLTKQDLVASYLAKFETNISVNQTLEAAIKTLSDAVTNLSSTNKTLASLESAKTTETALSKTTVVNDIPVSTVVNGNTATDTKAKAVADALNKPVVVSEIVNPIPTGTTGSVADLEALLGVSTVSTANTVSPVSTVSPVVNTSLGAYNTVTNKPVSSSQSLLSKIVSAASTLRPIGWFANGIDSIPYDNYPAMLHKGEKVMTASETKLSNDVGKKLDDLLTLLESIGVSQIRENIKTNKLLTTLVDTNYNTL